jgi:hypothetical protein
MYCQQQPRPTMSPFSLARLSALLKPIHKRHPRKRALCIGIRNVQLLPTDGADAYGELLHAHSDVDKVVQMLKGELPRTCLPK